MNGEEQTEVVLAGGNVTPVVRRGDAVHREAGPWTPAVHRLLRTLRGAGISGVPEPLGFDESGREVLSFLPGGMLSDAAPGVQWSDGVLRAAARLLRRIHDASEPLTAETSLVWRTAGHEPAEVICHNDFATYNLIVEGDALVGVIDFDFAAPGSRVWDLSYLAYRIVPLAEDATGADGLDRTRRLHELIEAYGTEFDAAEVVSTAAARLDELRAFTLGRLESTGRAEFGRHAAMYARDAARLRSWRAR